MYKKLAAFLLIISVIFIQDACGEYPPEPQTTPADNSLYFPISYKVEDCELCKPKFIIDWFASAAFANKRGELYELHLSFEENKPGENRWAFQPFIGIASGTESESLIAGIDALFKIPVIAKSNFFMDIEIGGGLQQAGPESFPSDGSHFNFRPQGGFGFRYLNKNGGSTIFGVRYHHVSNADISLPNPGVDNIFLYGGFQLRF